MDADLDLLLIAVYCTVDDLLPRRAGNARRRILDAEVITLAIAQAIMGIPSDPRFLAVAARRLAHLFPQLPERTAFHKRRLRLSGVIERLISEFARHSPGFYDDLLLVDSTPLECARSRETVKRSALADAADCGYCPSHSRFFWGFRLHAIFAPDDAPRALALASPKRDEREVALKLLERCRRHGGETVTVESIICGRACHRDPGATSMANVRRPARLCTHPEGLPARELVEGSGRADAEAAHDCL